ncbi:MAG: hypothetical protein ISP32_05540 [Thermoleophilia bacterium]|nr:hypothetical protein [Thermoleophilia bacterium]
MRDTTLVEPSESVVELIVRIASGVTMAVAAVATGLAITWVLTSPDSDGSWWPVVPWAVITLLALGVFALLLARSKSRHATR